MKAETLGDAVVSKTRLTEWVKAFRADDVADGLEESPELLTVRDQKNRNWLHLCAGVDVTRKRGLDVADSVRLADVLLKLGIDVNDAAFKEGSWCATALWYAVGRGRNLALAEFLLDQGSTPEHCLWAASFNEDVDMIELLVERGAPLEAIAEAETPLLGAVKWSRFKGAGALLAAGADPDFQDAKGMTAFHYMLKKGTAAKSFDMFIESGARGDIPGPDGRTAIEILSRKRDPAFRRLAERLSAAG